MKTFELPPCQRRSSRLRPKTSPAYARGWATLLVPLVLYLGLLLLSLPLTPPFSLTRLMRLSLRLGQPTNKTESGKTSEDRIRQDPNRQDPLQSAPLPLLRPHDSPTPTLSPPYPSILSPQRIGWLAPLSLSALSVFICPTCLPLCRPPLPSLRTPDAPASSCNSPTSPP